MTNQRVKIGFKAFKDAELLQKTEHILQSMTGNANFATPSPTLIIVKAAYDKYSLALGKVVDGTKQDTILKNQARADLEDLLQSLGLYVQVTSNGDEAIMSSSGFDLGKIPAPVGILPKPDAFTVETNVSKGCIDLSLNAIPGARSYQYEYTEVPATATSIWRVVSSTVTFVTITGLTSAKEYSFRVTGVGSDPTRVYSDEIEKVAP